MLAEERLTERRNKAKNVLFNNDYFISQIEHIEMPLSPSETGGEFHICRLCNQVSYGIPYLAEIVPLSPEPLGFSDVLTKPSSLMSRIALLTQWSPTLQDPFVVVAFT